MELHHKLLCNYSGLQIGELRVITTIGALPYLSHWNKLVCLHPVFSLQGIKLFGFVKNEWQRLAQRTADEEITTAESNILRVGFLACLHSLDCIKQDCPALPPLHIVQGTLPQLLALSYWKYYLESERFKFPTLHICELNENTDFQYLEDYFQTCFAIKIEYEKKVRDVEEKEKLRSAEAALKALNSEWVKPVGKKMLWTWVKAHLPEKYSADAQGWLSTLFLGGSSAIVDFDEEDIDLMEEIITSECPNGTGVMRAVRERVGAVRKIWEQYNRTFEIELGDFADNAGTLVNGHAIAVPDPGPEPILPNFQGNKALFFVAQAKWKIATAAYQKWMAGTPKVCDNPQLGAI